MLLWKMASAIGSWISFIVSISGPRLQDCAAHLRAAHRRVAELWPNYIPKQSPARRTYHPAAASGGHTIAFLGRLRQNRQTACRFEPAPHLPHAAVQPAVQRALQDRPSAPARSPLPANETHSQTHNGVRSEEHTSELQS